MNTSAFRRWLLLVVGLAVALLVSACNVPVVPII
jgi:hypothetical protein